MQDARILIRCGGMHKDCDWLRFDRKINGCPRIIKCDKIVTYCSMRYLLFIASLTPELQEIIKIYEISLINFYYDSIEGASVNWPGTNLHLSAGQANGRNP